MLYAVGRYRSSFAALVAWPSASILYGNRIAMLSGGWRLRVCFVLRALVLTACFVSGLVVQGIVQSGQAHAAETAALQTPPVVLATTRPLHSLASVVTEGVGDVSLLIKDNSSPHTFQLLPSHIRAVSNADVILWAGDGVERFLPSLMARFAEDAMAIEVGAMSGIVRHHSRRRDQSHDRKQPTGQQAKRAQDELDYHLWLDPKNALLIVQQLAADLSVLDPSNSDKYLRNAKSYELNLSALEENINKRLSVVAGKRYLVYHDSLQYFEKAFGLGEAIVVTPQPQMQAGAKRLKALHSEVAEWQPQCVLAEVQFRSLALTTLADDLKLKTVTIDPLASGFDAGAALYTDWMEHTAATIEECFQSTIQD